MKEKDREDIDLSQEDEDALDAAWSKIDQEGLPPASTWDNNKKSTEKPSE